MKRYNLVKNSSLMIEGKLKIGTMDLANTVAHNLKFGIPYMLAPQIDPKTGEIFEILLERQDTPSEDFDAMMDKWAKEIEEECWIVLQYRVGSISLEEAHEQRDELQSKRREKIREEELAKAKAKLIEFMEGL